MWFQSSSYRAMLQKCATDARRAALVLPRFPHLPRLYPALPCWPPGTPDQGRPGSGGGGWRVGQSRRPNRAPGARWRCCSSDLPQGAPSGGRWGEARTAVAAVAFVVRPPGCDEPFVPSLDGCGTLRTTSIIGRTGAMSSNSFGFARPAPPPGECVRQKPPHFASLFWGPAAESGLTRRLHQAGYWPDLLHTAGTKRCKRQK